MEKLSLQKIFFWSTNTLQNICFIHWQDFENLQNI